MSPSKAAAAKFCLFDMDGLLLNTEDIYTEVTQSIVEPYGKTYDWTLKKQMMGLREREAAELIVRELELPMTPEEYLVLRNKGHESKFPECKPLPGVLKLISHLKEHGVPIAVATSSHRKAFELKSMNNRALFDLFGEYIICGDDPRVQKGKPHPDIFLAAAAALGANMEDHVHGLVFEDAPSGVKAGLNANMNVIWIPDANLERDVHLEQSAAAVLSSMEDFVPEHFGLPPFRM